MELLSQDILREIAQVVRRTMPTKIGIVAQSVLLHPRRTLHPTGEMLVCPRRASALQAWVPTARSGGHTGDDESPDRRLPPGAVESSSAVYGCRTPQASSISSNQLIISDEYMDLRFKVATLCMPGAAVSMSHDLDEQQGYYPELLFPYRANVSCLKMSSPRTLGGAIPAGAHRRGKRAVTNPGTRLVQLPSAPGEYSRPGAP